MDTITITFPAVKVKIPIKGLTFDILENMLFEILQNIARKVFEKAITEVDIREKEGNLKTLVKGKNTFSPVLVISSILAPVTKTRKTKAIIS